MINHSIWHQMTFRVALNQIYKSIINQLWCAQIEKSFANTDRDRDRDRETEGGRKLLKPIPFDFKFDFQFQIWAMQIMLGQSVKLLQKRILLIHSQQGQHTKYNIIIKANSMASHLHTLMSEQLPYLPLPIYLPCNLP